MNVSGESTGVPSSIGALSGGIAVNLWASAIPRRSYSGWSGSSGVALRV
jgi:hypothetical protein